MFKVNVSPDMGMYHLLRNQGYDPAYAVAEFIDNALHAAFLSTNDSAPKRSSLDVSLYFYSNDFPEKAKQNSIVIHDNGPGITKTRLTDAMKPAKATLHKGLSEFGIGMKAAAVWFSDKWSLNTKPDHSTHKYDLTFDLAKLLEQGADQVEVTEHPREQSDGIGTTITLHHLRRPIDKEKYDLICKDLLDLYQLYTEGSYARLKLTAYFNDTPKPIKYDSSDRVWLNTRKYKTIGTKSYAFGEPREWVVPIEMVFQGVKIEGNIGILETGSYVDNPGIVMLRSDRVIAGTVRKPNLPIDLFKTSNKYARQRVYGRLFADGLPVAYTKDSFEIDEKSFWEQLRAVEGVEELFYQTEHYRVKNDPIIVETESDIPGNKKKPGEANAGTEPTPPKNPAPTAPAKPANRPQKPAAEPALPPLVSLLKELKPKSSTLALQAMMDETIYQHQFRREVATAMCLRSVLELAVLERIKADFPSHYLSVSDMGIKKVVGYMNARLTDFFDKRIDHSVIKCVQGTANGSQFDVVLLNNAAHGTFHPTLRELNIFVRNLEPVFRWAFG